MNRDFSNYLKQFRLGKFIVMQDIQTGTIVFRCPVADSKKSLELFASEQEKWLDWYGTLLEKAEKYDKLMNDVEAGVLVLEMPRE